MAGKLKIVRLRRAVESPPPVPVVRVSGIKPESRGVNTSRGARQCTRCQGRIRDGNWLHDVDCPETVLTYKRYGTVARWPCPYHCKPVELAEAWTHHYACLFWTDHLTAHPW